MVFRCGTFSGTHHFRKSLVDNTTRLFDTSVYNYDYISTAISAGIDNLPRSNFWLAIVLPLFISTSYLKN